MLDELTPELLLLADVSGDGKVNSSDARKLLRHSAKLELLEEKYVVLTEEKKTA